MKSERIVGIVLINHKKPVGFEYPLKLLKKHYVLRMIDMMEYACGEDDIETRWRERNFLTIKAYEFGAVAVSRFSDIDASL